MVIRSNAECIDVVVIENDEKQTKELKAYHGKELKIKNPRELKYFLRIQIVRSREEL